MRNDLFKLLFTNTKDTIAEMAEPFVRERRDASELHNEKRWKREEPYFSCPLGHSAMPAYDSLKRMVFGKCSGCRS